MSAYKKLKLLVWKNFVLQKRHKFSTAFEIISPVIFSLFLILTRCLVDPISKPGLSYEPFLPTYFNMSGRNLGNLTTSGSKAGTLAFSPENPLTRNVTKNAIAKVATDNLNMLFALLFDASYLPKPIGYKNALEMEKALTKPNVMDEILVGIEFEDSMAGATEWPDDIVVKLRFPAVMRTPMVEHPLRASWRTNLLYPLFPGPGPRAPDDSYGGHKPGYSPEMFLAVQHALSQEIIKEKSGKSFDTKVYLQRLPQNPYREDLLLMPLERFVSMIIMLCFAYSFVNTVKLVTMEKELQLKETMTIMGLPSWLHWLAWFIKQFSFLTISVILIVILFKIPFNRTGGGHGYSVLTFTPWSVLLFFMLLFIVASLAFSFMVSVFFSRANTAASFMGLAWFTAYSVYMLTQVLYEDINLSTKLILSLISNTAMGYAFQMMIMCEGTTEGLQWDQFFTPISYHDELQPAHIVFMLILDSILYMLIAMYVEKIRPGLYGVPLPWYFPFTKSFWRPNKKKVAEISRKDGADVEYNDALLKVVHDEEPKGVPMGVNIQNLTKVFKGRKKAVDNLSMRMYVNEITVLLGHNGAGKTTTISMLTGMVPPSSGTATINGYSIVNETSQARKSLGICPQHNVLFPDLTVAEHIIFYAQLKGVKKNKLNDEVKHFLKLLELEDKRDVTSDKLSGGQKRRLSVGAAMCGSSRVVLLDEPTSGLDPAARRALWDLLQKEKKGRTMIITTHFMDEADVLGDRIAIMSGGRLQCVGTPYFLKKHYGIGYKLTIVKGENCVVDDVTRFLKDYVPDVKQNTNIGTELTYILSNDNVSKFPEMLKEFETKKDSFNISSYGLSVTNLEEVFMKAGAEDIEETQSPIKSNGTDAVYKDTAVVPAPNDNHIMDNEPIEKVRGFKLLRNHIKAMFLKLAYNSMRNKLAAFIQFVTPIINITISVIICRTWKFLSSLPPLELSLESGFRSTQTLMSQSDLNDGSIEAKAMNAYKDYFKTSFDPGMTLTDIGTSDLGKYYLKLSAADIQRVRYEVLIGATFSNNNITAWFSNYGYHDSAISLAHINNAILSALSPGSTLTIINYPLPYSIENLVKVMATGSSMGFQFAFNIGFCLAFVTAFLVLFVIKERTSGAKLLQRVSGVRPAVMWVTALVWDWLWLLLVYLCIIITLAFYQEATLSTPAELGRVLLVLMVFSIAMIPIHYLASFYFDAAATGFSKMCFMNIFSGCMPFLITELLRLPEVGSPFYASLFDWIFAVLPIYCLSRSFRDMSVSSFSILACDGICEQLKIDNCTRDTICHKLNFTVCCIEDDPFMKWDEPGIGRYLFTMSFVGITAFTILLIKEYELINKIFYKTSKQPTRPLGEEDSDVAAERAYIQSLTRQQIAQHSLVCLNLTKFYKKFLAVNRITLGVRKGECFGLLGANGAGKTTTFRMLTGDEPISAGDAYVHGLPIKTRIQDVYRHIGYCPQFDALFDNLSGRETLRIFCLLRGIPSRIGNARALHLASQLGFLRHYDKKVHQCSGGTKRKISTAIALLGDSPLIFLDEPTTGMDPASKRLTWSAISDAVLSGRSIVLTSHSMEECEALCSRLTVVVRGTLHCLGPLQHLKNKFSQGYTLIIKCSREGRSDTETAAIDNYISENFNQTRLIESYLSIRTYYVNDADLPWWRVFAVMEQARTQLPIEDYSVSQTTLEQVFLRFTKLKEEAEPIPADSATSEARPSRGRSVNTLVHLT